MMRVLIPVWLIALFVSLDMSGQSIDSVLSQIRVNNIRIKGAEQLAQSEKFQARRGNSLYNPFVEYDYLNGRPDEAGNQKDFMIVQSFDFPTVYLNKNKAAGFKEARADHQVNATIQDILLEAKLTCLEIIYRTRQQTYLRNYYISTQQLVSDFQKKLDSGEGNVLDLNKAKLMLFEISSDLSQNNLALSQLNQNVTEMNAGISINISDSVYPRVSTLLPFELLEKEFEENDPERKRLEAEVSVSEQNLKIAKSQGLPKMEVGYHYQGILGQQFSGFHSGITIPLWENKNNVKLNRAVSTHAELELQSHRSEHFTEIKNLYDQYVALSKQLSAYNSLMQQANQAALLSKALTTGYISSIEYFMEMRLFLISMQRYLEMEMEYQKVIARLLKYQL
jgi:outer membrane protein, heavy metal efflux system